MAKTEIRAAGLGEPSGAFSQAIRVDAPRRLLFISGMVPKSADGSVVGKGDVEAQTRQVCENIKAAVEAAGGTLDDVCRLDVYVRNIEHRHAIYKVRSVYFNPPLPTSTMVEVTKLVHPEYLIEMTATAAVGGDQPT